ncbi:restriction endonuclease subunit S [Flavobacterium erciyesense]|uniref:restriction endonuclease subunit S n=1 Tax=Flavobacterium erciyesense TaxID=2825842 RepID=UPI001CECAF62|nr:restriction endonuclease subunit S [Flavobacterium erciyesense]
MRFPGFTEEWETKKLADINIINPKNENLPFSFIYIDLESVVNGRLLKEERISKDEAPSRAQRRLTKGDILFQMVRPYQKNNLYFDKEGDYVASTGYAQIRTLQNSQFVFQYLHNQKFVDKVIERCTGTSYPAINSSDLGNIKIHYPNSLEQSRIAFFFELLDNRIQTQNKIIKGLETLKFTLSNKIFSQELRFKDGSGNEFSGWSELKIGDILKIGNGKDYKHLVHGDIPVFGSGGYMTSVNSYLYDGETVCIGRKGTINKPMYYNGKIWTVDTLFYTHSFQYCIPKFVFHLFQTINWLEYNEASGVPSLSKTTIEKIKVKIPSIEEQLTISKFLSAFEQKIGNEKEILMQLKKQKEYLSQQMFI